jgi:hypothetical protein
VQDVLDRARLPLHDELQRDLLHLLDEQPELLQLHLLHLLTVSGGRGLAAAAAR